MLPESVDVVDERLRVSEFQADVLFAASTLEAVPGKLFSKQVTVDCECIVSR